MSTAVQRAQLPSNKWYGISVNSLHHINIRRKKRSEEKERKEGMENDQASPRFMLPGVATVSPDSPHGLSHLRPSCLHNYGHLRLLVERGGGGGGANKRTPKKYQ